MNLGLRIFYTTFLISSQINFCVAQNAVRHSVNLNKSWTSIATSSDSVVAGFESASFIDRSWKRVDVPHNWDGYDGYRRLRHGNKHGTAWYRKKFQVSFSKQSQNQYFLFFEGVGSYATVWLNGKQVGYHAGGRTTFTIDVTDVLLFGNKKNVLAVKAEHPAFIKDLPWVCGGCSDERGFSEGSQPMGIFRPVQLVIKSDIGIEPFGVHAWNDANVHQQSSATISVTTDIQNHSKGTRSIDIIQQLYDKQLVVVGQVKRSVTIKAGEAITIPQHISELRNLHLWDPSSPYLYKLKTKLVENGKTVDEVTTDYGIRSVYWSSKDSGKTNQFFINGKPFFINGIAEYEHLMGNSHAFSEEQIRARALQMKAIGFNAFRDGHQPHNLRYNHYWDSLGILWWTQISAHVWYDTPAFRHQFKQLLKEWVKERRNSPSIVLWGLQNESKLPEDFARECSDIIRAMDPTASLQRLITTCNGGRGTDWDVPQNWTGTYGGDPNKYAEDVKRQILIGEYGAWRTLELHSEGAYSQDSILSEDRMTALMETKVRLAETAKDSAAGHFFWLYNSHDNPGRVQAGEAYRELDRIGPVNYKGLLTNWDEPADVYYMYQSNYTDARTHPMLYIASHTWPDRWKTPGIKSGIIVYSNCDEVELFNDVNNQSLGRKRKSGIGTHFQWDNVNIQFNVLYAIGYVNGKVVTKDCIVLTHLQQAPHFRELVKQPTPVIKAVEKYHYLYRVNCGGADYTDSYGKLWMADRHLADKNHWGSTSWSDAFAEMPPYFASQRQTYDPVAGTVDWPLFQQFRYGRSELQFYFPVPNGTYRVELYFMEPWIGKAGGVYGKGWRLFDVAINDQTVLKDVDLWKEAGHDRVIKKVVEATVHNGMIRIHFPKVAVGQAVISAIAIASKNAGIKPASASPPLLILQNAKDIRYNFWLKKLDQPFVGNQKQLVDLPAILFGAEWLQLPSIIQQPLKGTFGEDVDLYIAIEQGRPLSSILKGYDDTRSAIIASDGMRYTLYKKRCTTKDIFNIPANDKLLEGMMVFVSHASDMQPPYDQKQLVTYKAADARPFNKVLQKQNIADKPMMVFTQDLSDTLEWEFETGVADIYSLTIKYNSPQEKELQGILHLMAADGSHLKTEVVHFTNTRPGKWNYISTTTGSMVNAGKYKLQLSGKGLTGLVLNSLEVQ
jgi:beta-galactosidase